MNKRYAVKGLIKCEDDRYLCVAGRRGMWNFVGGRRKTGETPIMTFLREADEEIVKLSSKIKVNDLKEPYPVRGVTTSRSGLNHLTRWLIFEADLLVPHTELTIANTAEITDIGAFSAEECLEHPYISYLAKQVIERAVT